MSDGDIFGVFAYPDSDVRAIKSDLFDRVEDSSVLSESVAERIIASSKNDRYFYTVDAPEYAPDEPHITVTPRLPCLVLRRDESGVRQAEEPGRDEYVDLFAVIYEHLPECPAAGYILDGDQSGGLIDGTNYYEHPITAASLANEQFNDAAWVMLFPPALADAYGIQGLQQLPIRRFDELADGAVLIVAPGDPTLSTEWREIASELGTPAADSRPF
ncbi:hypothetical protein [Halomicrobium salinisoli]|uniref:hypothetical protein n=1 Tax=Halomicrobium salinisoli TaxID=2878391 RepID=UPI001CF0A895|nr:hypothetical protein [Halomicrobium salinisoli]